VKSLVEHMERLEARVADELLDGNATVDELRLMLHETRDHVERAVNNLIERGEVHVCGKRHGRGRPERLLAITRTSKAA
jgi:predicted transcriptional regulator